MKRIFILNGPNLNKLGTREPEIYGTETLSDIENGCRLAAQEHNLLVDFRQSNSEAELIGWIQNPPRETCGIIINGAALTHTSIALHDALKMLDVPAIEVHLSNPARREDFRHISYISAVTSGVISGFGAQSYYLAIEALASLVSS